MNILDKFDEIKINRKCLTDKKEHTTYKIQYVVEYVKNWLYVVTHMNQKNIIFIDCMCNAGVYKDGDLTTAMEIFLLFWDNAKKYVDKEFYIFLNDIEKEKIENNRKVAEYICDVKDKEKFPSNIHFYVGKKDVNEYLNYINENYYHLLNNGMKILYVDPYDIGTVQISNVKQFIEKQYCELIYNLSTFDLKRNADKDKGRIKKALGSCFDKNVELVVQNISNYFIKGTKLKYYFSYPFKNSKNSEIYQIVFLTPHIQGLRCLKTAVYDVFNGPFCYSSYIINKYKRNTQISFIDTDEVNKNYNIDIARDMLINNKCFQDKKISYEDIELFLLQKTVLKSTEIISKVLKPLIKEGHLRKCNCNVIKSNYTNDYYEIIK